MACLMINTFTESMQTGMQSISTLTLTTSVLRMMVDASKDQLKILLIFLVKCFNKQPIFNQIIIKLYTILIPKWLA